MSRVINERAQVLKNHYCNPIIMTSNGCEQALPTCDPFHYICNGGDNGELDKNLRAHLEWTCLHEAERRNIGFENLSFHDWYKVRFGDTVTNEQVIKRFQWNYDYYRSSLSCDEGDKNLPHRLYSPLKRGIVLKTFPPINLVGSLRLIALIRKKGLKGVITRLMIPSKGALKNSNQNLKEKCCNSLTNTNSKLESRGICSSYMGKM